MRKLPVIFKDPLSDINALYAGFDAPINTFDCGRKCAVHNPSGKPFCCDICQAVPAAYQEEWSYLQKNTDLWHVWRGDECADCNPGEHERIQAETPDNMLLLACLGPSLCQRPFRALSCRQFPFFPYISSDYRFIGLGYEWEFENTCWVISNLGQVSEAYRQQFVEMHERLFANSQEVFESYQLHSEQMRAHFASLQRRFVILHRNGGYYLVSPRNERMARIASERLPAFGYYLRDL